MPFEIPLTKPTARERESNRAWLALVLAALPQFREEQRDHRAAAMDLANDIGLSVDEYVERGIGLAAEDEREDCWVRVSFWEREVTIELPNFPKIEKEAALHRAAAVIALLQPIGFTVCDPRTGMPIAGNMYEVLVEAYTGRQRTVEHVAALTVGKPV